MSDGGLQRAQAAPDWLQRAMAEMQAKYPDDRFEVTPRKPTAPNSTAVEWRLKCLDCPGKVSNIRRHLRLQTCTQSYQLYTPGPGETLQNYEVHLKNRLHRQKVNTRLEAAQATS